MIPAARSAQCGNTLSITMAAVSTGIEAVGTCALPREGLTARLAKKAARHQARHVDWTSPERTKVWAFLNFRQFREYTCPKTVVQQPCRAYERCRLF
jgi:hypothetical protein